MQLKNKNAIVTGGNQGIGKGIALALARAGANVIIQYNTAQDKALNTVNEIKALGQNAIAIQSDFSKKNAPEKLLQSALQEFQTIDILINSAAIYHRGPLLELTEDLFALFQKINVQAPLELIQGFAHHLIKRKTSGSIINISSISGLMPSFGTCVHSCAKAALDMLTRCAALELASYQIRVNCIAPGASDTESNEASIQQDPLGWQQIIHRIPLKRLGQPIDYGALAVFLASDSSSFMTGVTIPCDGGTTISLQ